MLNTIGQPQLVIMMNRILHVILQLTQSNLRPLQVLDDGDMPIQLLLNQSNVLNLFHSVFKRAVAKVEPTSIHSGSNYFLQHCRVAGRRSNCRQDASTF